MRALLQGGTRRHHRKSLHNCPGCYRKIRRHIVHLHILQGSSRPQGPQAQALASALTRTHHCKPLHNCPGCYRKIRRHMFLLHILPGSSRVQWRRLAMAQAAAVGTELAQAAAVGPELAVA